MSQNVEVARPARMPGILVGIGAILVGVAALLVAFQWQTYTTISVDGIQRAPPPSPKLGYSLVSTVSGSGKAYDPTVHRVYLLDRDSGRIWIQDKMSINSWKEVKVESLTPHSSPAYMR